MDTTNILTIVLIGLFVIIALGMMILWFAMLLDAFKHPNQQGTMWLVLLICFGSIGGIMYYFAVYRKRKKSAFLSDNYSTLEPVIPADPYTINNDGKVD